MLKAIKSGGYFIRKVIGYENPRLTLVNVCPNKGAQSVDSPQDKKAAHGTREAVITTIKNLPARWSEEEIALFFQLISQKYSDNTNGIEFSEDETINEPIK